jgi:hypothetical protein
MVAPNPVPPPPPPPQAESPSASASAKPGVSDRKREANRRNAQKSTGPRTAEGKANACLNALLHGLRAQVMHLSPGESRNANAKLDPEKRGSHRPRGLAQERLARQAAKLCWKLEHRLPRAERLVWAEAITEEYEQHILCEQAARGVGERAAERAANRVPLDDYVDQVFAESYCHGGSAPPPAREVPPTAGGSYGTSRDASQALARLERYEAHLRRELQTVLRTLVALQKHQKDVPVEEEEPEEETPAPRPNEPTADADDEPSDDGASDVPAAPNEPTGAAPVSDSQVPQAAGVESREAAPNPGRPTEQAPPAFDRMVAPAASTCPPPGWEVNPCTGRLRPMVRALESNRPGPGGP